MKFCVSTIQNRRGKMGGPGQRLANSDLWAKSILLSILKC